MINKEVVHLIGVIVWGIFGLTVGTLSVIHNNFSAYVMVSMVAAIVGNSAHLIALSLSKTGLQVSSETQKPQ